MEGKEGGVKTEWCSVCESSQVRLCSAGLSRTHRCSLHGRGGGGKACAMEVGMGVEEERSCVRIAE